jgi:CBS domain-containing protein
MGTVKNILERKGDTVHTVSPDTFVYDALETLEDNNVGALIVVENGRFIGVFTERDYARKVILKGRSSKETRVRDIISERHPYVTLGTSIGQCMELMTEKYVRHLPVLEGGGVVGIVSIGDVVKFIIDEKDYIIDNLRSYIVS